MGHFISLKVGAGKKNKNRIRKAVTGPDAMLPSFSKKMPFLSPPLFLLAEGGEPPRHRQRNRSFRVELPPIKKKTGRKDQNLT